MDELMKEHLKGFERRKEESEHYRENMILQIEGIKTSLNKQDIVLGTIRDDAKETKVQAKLTNGYVAELKLWQAYIKGALAILTVLVVPILLMLIKNNL